MSTPQTATATHQRLAWAYLDRMAVGDFARASVVLSAIASLYPSTREAVISVVAPTQGALFPRTLESWWGGQTPAFVGILLRSYFVATEDSTREALAQRLGSTAAANVGAVAQQILSGAVIARGSASGNAIDGFLEPIRQADVGSLNDVLTQLIAASLDPPATPVARAPIPDPAKGAEAPRQMASTPMMLPETRIVGRATSVGIPTWGWMVLGAVGIGTAGYLAYRYLI